MNVQEFLWSACPLVSGASPELLCKASFSVRTEIRTETRLRGHRTRASFPPLSRWGGFGQGQLHPQHRLAHPRFHGQGFCRERQDGSRGQSSTAQQLGKQPLLCLGTASSYTPSFFYRIPENVLECKSGSVTLLLPDHSSICSNLWKKKAILGASAGFFFFGRTARYMGY